MIPCQNFFFDNRIRRYAFLFIYNAASLVLLAINQADYEPNQLLNARSRCRYTNKNRYPGIEIWTKSPPGEARGRQVHTTSFDRLHALEMSYLQDKRATNATWETQVI